MKPCPSPSLFWKLTLGVLLLATTIAGGEVAQSEKTGESNRPDHVGPMRDGRIIIPTNQVLKPAGRQVTFPGRPNDVALSPDHRLLAVLSLREVLSIDVESGRILGRAKISGASYKGIVFTPDGKQLFVSTSPTSRTDKKRGAIVRLLVQPDGTLQPGQSISLGRSGGEGEANAEGQEADEADAERRRRDPLRREPASRRVGVFGRRQVALRRDQPDEPPGGDRSGQKSDRA